MHSKRLYPRVTSPERRRSHNTPKRVSLIFLIFFPDKVRTAHDNRRDDVCVSFVARSFLLIPSLGNPFKINNASRVHDIYFITHTPRIIHYSGRSRADMDQRHQFHNDGQFREFYGPENQAGHAGEHARFRRTHSDHRTSDAMGLGIVHVQDNVVASRLHNAHAASHTSVYTHPRVYPCTTVACLRDGGAPSR